MGRGELHRCRCGAQAVHRDGRWGHMSLGAGIKLEVACCCNSKCLHSTGCVGGWAGQSHGCRHGAQGMQIMGVNRQWESNIY